MRKLTAFVMIGLLGLLLTPSESYAKEITRDWYEAREGTLPILDPIGRRVAKMGEQSINNIARIITTTTTLERNSEFKPNNEAGAVSSSVEAPHQQMELTPVVVATPMPEYHYPEGYGSPNPNPSSFPGGAGA